MRLSRGRAFSSQIQWIERDRQLQALVYDILPPVTAMTGCAVTISLWRLSVNRQVGCCCCCFGDDDDDDDDAQMAGAHFSFFRSVRDGIYAPGNAKMCSTLSLRSFPNRRCRWNGSNVRLIDDGPLSSFQMAVSFSQTTQIISCVSFGTVQVAYASRHKPKSFEWRRN